MRVPAVLLLLTTLATGQSGDTVAAIAAKGERLVEAGRLTEAQELYKKALRSFPGNPDLYYELGMVYFRQENWAEAIKAYKNSIHRNPHDADTLFYLAQAYFLSTQPILARETVARAAKLAPDNPQICQKYGEYLSAVRENRTQGLQWLLRARRLDPDLEDIDFEIGMAQYLITDVRAATVSFETALKKNPEDGRVAFFLAESWADLREWEKARDNFNYALSHGSADASAYYGLGEALVNLRQFQASIEPLQRALTMQPSLVQGHFQLGRAYRELGRIEDAERENTLFAAIKSKTTVPAYFTDVRGGDEEEVWNDVKRLLDVNAEPRALEYLSKLAARNPVHRANPYYLLGAVYFSMGRNQDAKRVLLTARTQDPKEADIPAYLGIVQLASGDSAAAEECFQSALEVDPDHQLAATGLGELRYLQHRWEDAVDYLEKSRSADPDVLYMLCDAYFHVGKTDQAVLTSEIIRALGSKNKDLLDAVDKLVRQHQFRE
jgi:tetratricopeptide (TPR) repeat protein